MSNTFVHVLLFSIVGQISCEPEIYHGDDAKIEDFPYTVTMYRNGGQYCGANIISEDILITAAHCVDANLKEFIISAGTDDCKHFGDVYRLERAIVHEDYDWNTPLNDLAIIKVARKLKLGSRVRPIPLARAGSNVNMGSVVKIAGCGNTLEYNRIRKVYADHLWQANMTVGACSDLDPSFDYWSLFCVSNKQTSASTCHGDSGAGYIQNGQLVGIESQGPAVCGQTYVSAGTIVGKYTNWIVNTIKRLNGAPPMLVE